MGCCFSTNTAVRPLKPEEPDGDELETGSKPDGRGDSAVSKVTTDSGVVMDVRETPVLPGGASRKLPPLSCVRESETDRFTQDGTRPKSSQILEELLNEGIIPVGQRGSTTGESFSIMLDDREAVRRRPPARLESLKANKTQSFSREQFDEKMRLADERRKLKEDELKTRLRTKSARVRGPVAPTFASSTDVDEHVALTPVEPILHPLAPAHLDPPFHSQNEREEAEGEERPRETTGDIMKGREEAGGAERSEEEEEGGKSGEDVRECADEAREADDGEEEELTQVEELKEDQLLAAPGELENDSSFQENRDEIF
ncbi:uncharacterized protein stmnd1 [Antennarius striatus]|uniref:uncharacterized protein stmnd1 n=1 Tax=Antennarius striatus TaxID=241820 RepID=UPI0035B3D1F4